MPPIIEPIDQDELIRQLRAMVTTLEFVTPQMAMQWLSKSKNRRPLKDWHVDDFVRHVDNGTWVPEQPGVMINLEGWCVNSQHRLWAIVKTGKGQYCWLTTNVPPIVEKYIDTGVSRNASNQLEIDQRVAQPARFGAVICYGTNRPTLDEIASVVVAIPQIKGLVEACPRRKNKLAVAPVKLAAALNAANGSEEEVFAAYKAFVSGDFDCMSTALQNTYKRFTESPRRIEERLALCIAYRAFNPGSDVSRVLVRDQSHTMDQIRAHVRGLVQGDQPES